jgi:hypothetical protein
MRKDEDSEAYYKSQKEKELIRLKLREIKKINKINEKQGEQSETKSKLNL